MPTMRTLLEEVGLSPDPLMRSMGRVSLVDGVLHSVMCCRHSSGPSPLKEWLDVPLHVDCAQTMFVEARLEFALELVSMRQEALGVLTRPPRTVLEQVEVQRALAVSSDHVRFLGASYDLEQSSSRVLEYLNRASDHLDSRLRSDDARLQVLKAAHVALGTSCAHCPGCGRCNELTDPHLVVVENYAASSPATLADVLVRVGSVQASGTSRLLVLPSQLTALTGRLFEHVRSSSASWAAVTQEMPVPDPDLLETVLALWDPDSPLGDLTAALAAAKAL